MAALSHEECTADAVIPGTALSPDECEPAANLFRCLSSSVRVSIVVRLAEGAQCVHQLVEALDLPQPLVSQHLRILRDANLVTRDRKGREMTYAIADDHVMHIVRDALTHTGEEVADDD